MLYAISRNISVFRLAGNDNGSYDVSQNTAAAQSTEQYQAKPYQCGIDVEVLGDTASDAV